MYGNLQEKCRARVPRHTFCASPRSRNAQGHVRRDVLCENLEENLHTSPTTSIKHRALTLTLRTPQCGHNVWGMNEKWRPRVNALCDLFFLQLPKVLHLPILGEARSYEILHLSRKIIATNLKIPCSKLQPLSFFPPPSVPCRHLHA